MAKKSRKNKKNADVLLASLLLGEELISQLEAEYNDAINRLVSLTLFFLEEEGRLSYEKLKKPLDFISKKRYTEEIGTLSLLARKNGVQKVLGKDLNHTVVMPRITVQKALEKSIQWESSVLHQVQERGLAKALEKSYVSAAKAEIKRQRALPPGKPPKKKPLSLPPGKTETGLDRILREEAQKKIENPWLRGEKNFRKRCELDDEKLRNNLMKKVKQQCATNKNITDFARDLAKEMNISLNNAKRLIRTEISAMHNKAELDALKILGVEFYEIVAVLDRRTSEICMEMDGKHFPVKEAVQGINAPPFHANCRTLVEAYYDDFRSEDDRRTYRDDDGKSQTTRKPTAKEWKKEQARKAQTAKNTPYAGRKDTIFHAKQEPSEPPDVKANSKNPPAVKDNADNSNALDLMKAKNMYVPEKGEEEKLLIDGLACMVKPILNSKNQLMVTQNGYSKKAVNYFDDRISKALRKMNLPEGTKLPNFVLLNTAKDIGHEAFGAYNPSTNTIYYDSSTFGQKAMIRKLRSANAPYVNNDLPKYFAVDDDDMAPIYHELGHFKHNAHIKHHAQKNGISYRESKERFNKKLVEYIEKNEYNINESISDYAWKGYTEDKTDINRTNELVSEAYVIYRSEKNNGLANYIIKLLEREGW